MKIYLGADHGGFLLKEQFKTYLADKYPQFTVEDCGAFNYKAEDDYPLIAFQVAEKVAKTANLGVLFCRSGSGVVIAANKITNIRAVDIYNATIAAHAKSHNQANIIAFGGDYLSLDQVIELFTIFQQTEVDPDQRHQRRIQEIRDYELNH